MIAHTPNPTYTGERGVRSVDIYRARTDLYINDEGVLSNNARKWVWMDGDEYSFESKLPETRSNQTTDQDFRPIDQSQSDTTTYKGGKRRGKRVKYN